MDLNIHRIWYIYFGIKDWKIWQKREHHNVILVISVVHKAFKMIGKKIKQILHLLNQIQVILLVKMLQFMHRIHLLLIILNPYLPVVLMDGLQKDNYMIGIKIYVGSLFGIIFFAMYWIIIYRLCRHMWSLGSSMFRPNTICWMRIC